MKPPNPKNIRSLLTFAREIPKLMRRSSTSIPDAPTTITTISEEREDFQPRYAFELPAQFDYRTWYPRHMSVQLKRMEGKLRSVDLIVEVCMLMLLLNSHFTEFYISGP